eukprot:TRINITY_DN7978_c0_g1_i1.p1 TRINITY_DN7978_c0_g1~~TRINITY_DN7978_c0_g1_i1.p1  ORF type:complete len:477 (+),score=91.48 TRINITY_DN7978_c0_g1_i1:507-1937(+)
MLQGDSDWNEIAKLLPRRTGEVCKQKWVTLHHVHIHDAPWTEAEDELLLSLINQHGLKKWTLISKEMNRLGNSAIFRQGKQCRERWINHLDPAINRGVWTVEEDMTLLSAFVTKGKKWSEISKIMEHRTENSVKNRWKSLLNKYQDDFCFVGEKKDRDVELCQFILRLKKKELAEHRGNDGGAAVTPKEKIERGVKERDSSKNRILNQETLVNTNTSKENQEKVSENNGEVPPSATRKTRMRRAKSRQSLPKSSNDKDGTCSNGHSTASEFTAQELSWQSEPCRPTGVAFKVLDIHNLDNIQEIEELEVCLVNRSKRTIYVSDSTAQRKTLNQFALSLMTLQEGLRDIPQKIQVASEFGERIPRIQYEFTQCPTGYRFPKAMDEVSETKVEPTTNRPDALFSNEDEKYYSDFYGQTGISGILVSSSEDVALREALDQRYQDAPTGFSLLGPPNSAQRLGYSYGKGQADSPCVKFLL